MPTWERAWLRLATVVVLTAGCASLAPRRPASIHVIGSDTMLVLAQRWAGAFMERNPGVVVTVEGGGSSTGIAALIAGRADVATGSRPLAPEEVRSLTQRSGTLGVSSRCARDAVSVYLNPSNPVRDLGLLQVKGIFSGRIGSWHKVGGREAPIHVIIRPPSSGTRRLFRSLVLDEEPFSTRATVLPTTTAIVDAVRADPDAVGFGGIAFGDDLVHVSIDGQAPTREGVRLGAYPLGRYLFLHAAAAPRGWTKRFIDFALGPEGQRIVDEVGFVPLWVEE